MTSYLDNAASSCPKPPQVVEAVDECLRSYCANPGRGAHATAVEAARIIHRTRQKAASFLGVSDSADIIFTANATDSLNIALHGLLSCGDHVVTSVVEHNAVARPLIVLEKQGVKVTRVTTDSTGRLEPEDIVSAIRPETRLVVLTHASNITGVIQPIDEINNVLLEKGVPLLLDAAQSAGTLKLDMKSMPVGMMACTGHKSLLGPQGVGLLYISPELELASVRQGGTGTHSDEAQDELARPDRYECGTLNTPGIAGLGAGITYIEEKGLKQITDHKNMLTAALHEGLLDIENVTVYGPAFGEPRGPLVAFNIAGMPSSEVAGLLDREYGIASRAGLHCAPGAHRIMGTHENGAVRLSVGLFNTTEEIEAALEAVGKIAASRP
ncbi:MAG: aminotransferase class V-fold PLP-dependent enzyme [Thermoleophilia bacterium]|jgi:cysteine desulfurase family protein